MKYFKPHKFPLSLVELSLPIGSPVVTGFTEVRREYGTQAECDQTCCEDVTALVHLHLSVVSI